MRGVLVKLRLLAVLEGYSVRDADQDIPARLVLGLISDIEVAT